MIKYILFSLLMFNCSAIKIFFEKHKEYYIVIKDSKRQEELKNYINKTYFKNTNVKNNKAEISYIVNDKLPCITVYITIKVNNKTLQSIMKYNTLENLQKDSKNLNHNQKNWKIDNYFIKKLAQHINKELQLRA